MTRVLNGPVAVGDVIAYTVRKHWGMATRIGVIVKTGASYDGDSLLVRVVKSSNRHVPAQLVWVTELQRVVKLKGGIE